MQRILIISLGYARALLQYGENNSEKPIIFIIARQHPGETPAAFFIEGLIEYLEKDEDPLLKKAVIYIVDNMNPDGTYHGNLRSNVAGIDLNRAWGDPDPENAPEVFCVKQFLNTLKERNIIFFDIHADESNAALFLEGRVGNYSHLKLDLMEKKLIAALKKIEPRIHKESCYPPDAPGEGNFNLAVTHIGQDHLSILIEQPFKEVAQGNDWTPKDCQQFGAKLPMAINLFLNSQIKLSEMRVGIFQPSPSSEKKDLAESKNEFTVDF